MADIRVQGSNQTTITSEGVWKAARALRDGTLSVADFLQVLALAGHVHIVSFGSETTPLTAVAYDLDQPEATLGVPSAYAVIPIEVEVMLESFAGTDNEIIVWRTTNAITSGGAAATEGPTSTRSTGGQNSQCTARQLHTANITQTAYRELWRGGQPLADTNPGAFKYNPSPKDLLIGPATLGVQVAGTSTQPTFYAKLRYAEVEAKLFD